MKYLFFLFLLSSIIILSFPPPAYAQRVPEETGELIVKFKDGQTPQEIEEDVERREENRNRPVIGAILNSIEDLNYRRQGEKLPEEKLKDITSVSQKAGVVETEKLFDNPQETSTDLENIHVVKTNKKLSIGELEKTYEALPEVEYAEPNLERKARAIPNDPFGASLWGLIKIQALQAWDISKGSQSVIVAVTDTGVSFTHSDLQANMWKNTQETINGVDDDGNGYKDDINGWSFPYNDNYPMDFHGHGTHVAGTIGAVGNNSTGVMGVNWTVKIMPIQVLGDNGSGNDSHIVAGIRYAADKGAKVINLSLGGSGQCSQSWQDAINYARSKGATVVVATGEGFPIQNMDIFPDTPTSCSGVIAVSATSPTDARADYAFYGSQIDIAAPGGNALPPSYTCTNSTCVLSTWTGNSYKAIEGTSMATPHVSGVIALMLSVNPNLTPDQIETMLKNNADAISTDYNISGKRLNAFKAVIAANPPTPTPTPIPAGPKDLDVTYIERTPRYYRYQVSSQNGIPALSPGTENQKRWPDIGENVTYTAHVKNKGTSSVPSFTYQWLKNGSLVNSGVQSASLEAGAETTFQYQTTFPGSPETIEFKVDNPNLVTETSENNNTLGITSHDLTISIWVETGQYDIFNTTTNLVGSKSFEDWIQKQILEMNTRFSQAVYTLSPQGIKDRIRIDKIVIASNLDGPGTVASTDPHEILIDGRWVFSDGDSTNAKGQGGVWQNYVNQYALSIDRALIHEISHQLGLVDLYRMGIKNDEPQSPNGGVLVKDINGNTIPRSSLNFPVFKNTGVMGGGETSPHNNDTYYESHSAGGLNSNYLKRRGYYGEYLFDTPQNSSVKVLDSSLSPIGNAEVKMYQKNTNTEDIDNTPEQTGTTDAQGIMSLVNRSVPTAPATQTGHTLRENPFGLIDIVGRNGNMIVKVTKGNQEGYGFLKVHDLNIAYWEGNTTTATITVTTNFPKVTAIPTPTPTPVEGDIDGDKAVTITDFNIWKDEFGGTLTSKTSDLNKDSKVDLLDYSIWRNKFAPNP